MSQQPISFSVPEATFDLTLLPEPAPQRGSATFQEAVTRYYKDAYREAGGRVDVAFAEWQIEVSWDPAADQRPARETITEHLEAGRYAEAIPLLETTLQLQPDDVQSLTQLGMVKSDLGELEEARRLLERAVQFDPTNGQALVSLGVAALRAGDPDGAEPPLQQAVALEPTNPYAHRALGQIHLMRDDPAGALPHLRLAADQPPTDPITLYTLAQCLMALAGPGQLDEAEACLNRALALGPPADLAERLRQTHSRLARQVLRANAGDGPRMDVVMYCASALESYAALAPAAQKQLLMEVATAGQKGLALNRSEAQLQLRHYRNGEPISHLQAACLLFVGLKLLLPDQESGFDFEREFGVAQGLVGSAK